MLEGILVDLVPYGARFLEQEHRWRNSEAWFWASAGGRMIESRAALRRDHEASVERRSPRPYRGIRFGIQTKHGVPLGDIDIVRFQTQSRHAILGAGIGEPDYWGGGYGTDALLLVVDFAFDWLDLRRLWLSTMSINARVLRQMEKVGFTQEARQRDAFWVDGHGWADKVTFGLLRSEWPGRAALIERLGLRAR